MITKATAYGRSTSSAAEVRPVIAEPDSTTTQPTDDSSAGDIADNRLTENERYRLTLYKWRYSLEACGFEQGEIRELLFIKWLHASGRVVP
jgi:hypothetical protein